MTPSQANPILSDSDELGSRKSDRVVTMAVRDPLTQARTMRGRTSSGERASGSASPTEPNATARTRCRSSGALDRIALASAAAAAAKEPTAKSAPRTPSASRQWS